MLVFSRKTRKKQFKDFLATYYNKNARKTRRFLAQ